MKKSMRLACVALLSVSGVASAAGSAATISTVSSSEQTAEETPQENFGVYEWSYAREKWVLIDSYYWDAAAEEPVRDGDTLIPESEFAVQGTLTMNSRQSLSQRGKSGSSGRDKGVISPMYEEWEASFGRGDIVFPRVVVVGQ